MYYRRPADRALGGIFDLMKGQEVFQTFRSKKLAQCLVFNIPDVNNDEAFQRIIETGVNVEADKLAI